MEIEPSQSLVNGLGGERARQDAQTNGVEVVPAAGPSLISTPHHSSSASKASGSSISLASTGPTPPKNSSPPDPPHIDPQQRPISPPPTTNSPSQFLPDTDYVDLYARRSAVPGPGFRKGYRTYYDPMLDDRLKNKPGESKEALERNRQNDKARRKDAKTRPFTHERYSGAFEILDPRKSIVGYDDGKCTPPDGKYNKAKLRPAPNRVPPYVSEDKTKIKAKKHRDDKAKDRATTESKPILDERPVTQVLVIGFNPTKQNLRAIFSGYGHLAELSIQRDPDTGTELPFCVIRYKDGKPADSSGRSATQAAKDAITKGPKDWIGGGLKVVPDREGALCRRRLAQYMKSKTLPKRPSKPAEPPKPEKLETSIAPLHAPRGPSSLRLGESPQTATTMHTDSRRTSLVSRQSKPSEPYIFITYNDLPGYIAFKPLRDRFKGSGYEDIRKCDDGWYVRFPSGSEHIMERSYNRFNNSVLPDIKEPHRLRMKCFPDIISRRMELRQVESEQTKSEPIVSPPKKRASPPKPALQKAEPKKAEDTEEDISRRGQEEDFELEKKLRAEGVDPVALALARITSEIADKMMESTKSITVMPLLVEMLDPDRHRDKRQKLGLPDKSSDIVAPSPSRLGLQTLVVPPKGPGDRRTVRHAPLRPHDPNARRGTAKASTDAFEDSRRRKKPVQRGGFRRLQDMIQPQDDSDEEDVKTPVTARDHDDESRPLSTTSRTSTPAVDDTFDTPMLTDIATSPPASIVTEPVAAPHDIVETIAAPEPHDSPIEPKFTSLVKELLGDCAHKRPEDMADKELAHTMSALDWQGPWRGFRKRCQLELEERKRAARDDAVFRVTSATPVADTRIVDEVMEVETQVVKAAKKRAPAKKKKKTKKELAADRAAQRKAKIEVDAQMEEAPPEQDVAEPEDDEEQEPETIKSTLPWAISKEQAQRTFDDESDVVLDLDGWQHLVKDDEDVALLIKTLAKTLPSEIQDARYWAWKQKRIKALNVPSDKHDAINVAAEIPGYYVPNVTGCARTEGIKKILNAEKSKYLPHRIKVQKAREEREALAANKDAAQAEVVKPANETFKTSSSRSNRANNRRLVNDIKSQKQNGPTSGADTDAFRFNQLKKRKKHVRFDRSAIHGWGLYTEENIPSGDLIIEYVGEKIRQKVADVREIQYDRQGVGSSYLFRMAEDEIIDATKKGGIARFINHSCMPNCTAKIIKVEGTRRIVIYALKDINRGEELTYDYKFERELFSNDRIPCLCGSVGCKGFLN